MKQTYIVGHRNPDTDSVVSAAAYAALKTAQGAEHCVAVRAGNLNPQTEYIFERFGVPPPEYVSDLIPKVRHYMLPHCFTIDEATSTSDALELMQKEGIRLLPIVDALGVYKSVLHYQGFARYIIDHMNPHEKAVFPVSIDSLTGTLAAQPITVYNSSEVKASSIIVAAAYNKYFIQHLEENNPADALVIMGDRFDLQEACIERGVRALILSNGHTLNDALTRRAEEKHVSVLSSPYDTSSTSMLIVYSVPAGAMGDASVPLLHLDDPIKQIRGVLSLAPGRSLAVGDEAGHVIGVLQESDLFGEPNIDVIMVDHNEVSQAIEGIENFRLLEVIDHHRLGNISTRYPITFINKPVGATATIVTNLYREQRLPMRKEIASLLLCAILSDTLSLKSSTTTDTDREAADYLARVTGLEIAALEHDLRGALDQINAKSAAELIAQDFKLYNEGNVTYSVSQLEAASLELPLQRAEEFLSALEVVRAERNLLFAALLLTDITALDSALIIAGKTFAAAANFPRLAPNVFHLKGVVSRKKQVIPLLGELLESLQKAGKL